MLTSIAAVHFPECRHACARREEALSATIEHLHLELRHQTIPHEIVVVDDGSSDGTSESSSTWSRRESSWLR